MIAKGDRDAFRAVYDRYAARCYNLARRLIRDEDLSADVIQEVFTTVWTSAERFDQNRWAVSSWLMTMTHHKSVDTIRREERIARLTLRELTTMDDRVLPSDHAAVTRVAIQRALTTLPQAERDLTAAGR